MTQYIEKKYVQKNSIEKRDYQVNLANQATEENCIVVLPTGLGKTAVALQVIATYLSKGTGGVLFLAPTRVLVNQHYEFLKENLTLDDISLITGEDSIQIISGNFRSSTNYTISPKFGSFLNRILTCN